MKHMIVPIMRVHVVRDGVVTTSKLTRSPVRLTCLLPSRPKTTLSFPFPSTGNLFIRGTNLRHEPLSFP